ncbi:MAG: hypothetical protein K2Z80_07000 [Xanthobacteraceae bacterium]|nr:hypothetical protein [Xanthobacteraceae bacterium]
MIISSGRLSGAGDMACADGARASTKTATTNSLIIVSSDASKIVQKQTQDNLAPPWAAPELLCATAVLSILIFGASITTPITAVHACNTRRRRWISNASFGVRCGHHRDRDCEARRDGKSCKGEDTAARDHFRFDFFVHQNLPMTVDEAIDLICVRHQGAVRHYAQV